MKTSKWLVLAMAAALLAGGAALIRSPAAEAAGLAPGHAHLLARLAQRLDLSDQQKAQIKAELKAESDTLSSLLTRMHEARTGLRAAIRAPDATEDSVRAAAAKVSEVESDFAVERLKLYGKINPILTPEQREKIALLEARVADFATEAMTRLNEWLAN